MSCVRVIAVSLCCPLTKSIHCRRVKHGTKQFIYRSLCVFYFVRRLVDVLAHKRHCQADHFVPEDEAKRLGCAR